MKAPDMAATGWQGGRAAIFRDTVRGVDTRVFINGLRAVLNFRRDVTHGTLHVWGKGYLVTYTKTAHGIAAKNM